MPNIAALDEVTSIGHCLGQEISCTDPVGVGVTIDSEEGNGLSLAEVKTRQNNDPTVLPLNVCTRTSLQRSIGQYEVKQPLISIIKQDSNSL